MESMASNLSLRWKSGFFLINLVSRVLVRLAFSNTIASSEFINLINAQEECEAAKGVPDAYR
jgi:hypothetical protein